MLSRYVSFFLRAVDPKWWKAKVNSQVWQQYKLFATKLTRRGNLAADEALRKMRKRCIKNPKLISNTEI